MGLEIFFNVLCVRLWSGIRLGIPPNLSKCWVLLIFSFSSAEMPAQPHYYWSLICVQLLLLRLSLKAR